MDEMNITEEIKGIKQEEPIRFYLSHLPHC